MQSLIYTQAVRKMIKLAHLRTGAVELVQENNLSSNEVRIHPVEELPILPVCRTRPRMVQRLDVTRVALALV